MTIVVFMPTVVFEINSTKWSANRVAGLEPLHYRGAERALCYLAECSVVPTCCVGVLRAHECQAAINKNTKQDKYETVPSFYK